MPIRVVPAPTRAASPAPTIPPASGVGRMDGQDADQQDRRECAKDQFHGVTLRSENEMLEIRNGPVSPFPSMPENFAYRTEPGRKTGGAKAFRTAGGQDTVLIGPDAKVRC